MIWLIALVLIFAAAPAEAGPVAGAIGAVVGTVKGAVAASATLMFAFKTAASIGLSLLAQRMNRPKEPLPPGIRQGFTTSGGIEPQVAILGRYATAGHMATPPYAHNGGQARGDGRQMWLSYVVELSDLPITDLVGVIVDDRERVLDFDSRGSVTTWAQMAAGTLSGFFLWVDESKTVANARVRFHAGRQTIGDRYLTQHLSGRSVRPWTADHIGEGVAHCVLSFWYDESLYRGFPRCRVIVDGIALYDPREDTTVGGDGPQRWDDPDTWTFSRNPAVMIYNIMRGIPFPGGRVWGGEVPAEDLPLDNWFAAMNVCDTVVDDRPQFQAGIEIKMADEPADVVSELLLTCEGQIAEFGGVFRIRCGPPAAPVLSITDADILLDEQIDLDLFPGLSQTHNYFTGFFVNPDALLQPTALAPVTDPEWEAEDGRRLSQAVSFNSVTDHGQATQLLTAMARDSRPRPVHRIVLPAMAAVLEPLDTLEWTSAEYGYDDEVFEVLQVTDRGQTLEQEVLIRARDPDAFVWTEDPPPPVPVVPETIGPVDSPDGFEVSAFTVTDSASRDRRAGILLEWDLPGDDGEVGVPFDQIEWEVRRIGTGVVVNSGSHAAAEKKVQLFGMLLPDTAHEARIRWVTKRAAQWTDWEPVTTDAVFTDTVDITPGAVTVRASALTTDAVANNHPAPGFVGLPEFFDDATLLQSVTLTLAEGIPINILAATQIEVTDAGATVGNVYIVAVVATDPNGDHEFVGGGLVYFMSTMGGETGVRFFNRTSTYTPTEQGQFQFRLYAILFDPSDVGFASSLDERQLIVEQFKR